MSAKVEGTPQSPMSDARSKAIEALAEALHASGACHDRRAPGATAHGLSYDRKMLDYLDAHPEARAALYLWLIATRPEPDTGRAVADETGEEET